ncbi:hypothetical protein K5549_017532, partial [Capra hircus]
SGLWRICEGHNSCIPLIDPFSSESLDASASVQHLISLHRAVLVVLPVSLVLIVCGWICGLLSSLAQNIPLLLFTGCYFLLGGESGGCGAAGGLRFRSGLAGGRPGRLSPQEESGVPGQGPAWELTLAEQTTAPGSLVGQVPSAGRCIEWRPPLCGHLSPRQAGGGRGTP